MTTIIVLIILAAVAINLALGNEGIIDRAKLAKEQYQNAQEYEEDKIVKYGNEIDSYVNGNRDTVTISQEEYNILKNANLYSEEEIIIGKWTNNKPIYIKVIYFPNKNLNKDSWNTVADVTNYNIEKLIHSQVLCTQNITSLAPAYVQVLSTSLQVYTPAAGIESNGIIIEYTKTTD